MDLVVGTGVECTIGPNGASRSSITVQTGGRVNIATPANGITFTSTSVSVEVGGTLSVKAGTYSFSTFTVNGTVIVENYISSTLCLPTYFESITVDISASGVINADATGFYRGQGNDLFLNLDRTFF